MSHIQRDKPLAAFLPCVLTRYVSLRCVCPQNSSPHTADKRICLCLRLLESCVAWLRGRLAFSSGPVASMYSGSCSFRSALCLLHLHHLHPRSLILRLDLDRRYLPLLLSRLPNQHLPARKSRLTVKHQRRPDPHRFFSIQTPGFCGLELETIVKKSHNTAIVLQQGAYLRLPSRHTHSRTSVQPPLRLFVSSYLSPDVSLLALLHFGLDFCNMLEVAYHRCNWCLYLLQYAFQSPVEL